MEKKVYHQTSDGEQFYEAWAAASHAKNLADKKVIQVAADGSGEIAKVIDEEVLGDEFLEQINDNPDLGDSKLLDLLKLATSVKEVTGSGSDNAQGDAPAENDDAPAEPIATPEPAPATTAKKPATAKKPPIKKKPAATKKPVAKKADQETKKIVDPEQKITDEPATGTADQEPQTTTNTEV